jgi:uncharacterized protein (TIGR02452 family)
MSDGRLMEREQAARLGAETVAICRRGEYTAPSGKVVSIQGALAEARKGTVSHPADADPPAGNQGSGRPKYEVINDTTLAVARRMTLKGRPPGTLNFASATHPGGGFLTGARAQEASLARSSGLYVCLEGDPFYHYHQGEGHNDHFYSHAAIYSPNVPVFRLEDGTLLEEPWNCTFVTSAAVMASRILESGRHSPAEIEQTMRERTERVLRIFRHHKHRHLLLGAWGCGAFGGDSRVMARLFKEALEGEFSGQFETVVFGITDWWDDRRTIGPFQESFGR